MKKSKKIISIVLAVAIALSVLTTVLVVTANTKETVISISVDKSELNTGESATVSVKVTSNYPIATMSIPVFYDKTLVDVSNATATLTDYSVANAITDTQSVDSTKVFVNTGVSDAKFGFVLVNYIGEAGAEVPENIDDVVLTFTVVAKDKVSGTATVKCTGKSQKTDANTEGMLYFGAPVTSRTINEIPENVENVDLTNAMQNIEISSVSTENTIKLKDSAPFKAVIDRVNCGDYNGTVYGFDTLGWNYNFEVDGTIADFLSTAYGDAYLEVVVGDAGVETTGTLINVLDEEGNAVETYVYIYFGDVDSDGMITSTDAMYPEYYEFMMEGIDTFAQFMASDIDGDGMLSSTDAMYAEYYEFMLEGMPTQAEIAESVQNNSYEIV